MASRLDELLSEKAATQPEPATEDKTATLHEPATQDDLVPLLDGRRNEGCEVSSGR